MVMAFEFGTNWSELSRMSGPIQGPLLTYETFTAFFLEASFFGILLFGRSRVPPWFYLFSTAMVALGTTLSAFWIMVNNSCDHLQPRRLGALPAHAAGLVPDRRVLRRGDGRLVSTARRIPCRGADHAAQGPFLAAVLVPAQIFFGHLVGDYVHDKQPVKFAAIEGRWHDEQPAGEVLIALPDEGAETNHYAISVPVLGSLIGGMSFTSKEVGLTDFPKGNRSILNCGVLLVKRSITRLLEEVGLSQRKGSKIMWLTAPVVSVSVPCKLPSSFSSYSVW
jgi:cytochrome d ubiquinol oxidase subunit I